MTWQARLLMAVMRVQKFFFGSNKKLDVAKDRANGENFAKVFKLLGKVDITPVNADGVPAAWIVPAGQVTELSLIHI